MYQRQFYGSQAQGRKSSSFAVPSRAKESSSRPMPTDPESKADTPQAADVVQSVSGMRSSVVSRNNSRSFGPSIRGSMTKPHQYVTQDSKPSSKMPASHSSSAGNQALQTKSSPTAAGKPSFDPAILYSLQKANSPAPEGRPESPYNIVEKKSSKRASAPAPAAKVPSSYGAKRLQSFERESLPASAMMPSAPSRPDQNQVSQEPSTSIPVERYPYSYAPDRRQSSLGAYAVSSTERPAPLVPQEMQLTERASIPVSTMTPSLPSRPDQNQSSEKAFAPVERYPAPYDTSGRQPSLGAYSVSSTERPAPHVPQEMQLTERASIPASAMTPSLPSRPDQNQSSQKAFVPVERYPAPYDTSERQSSLGAYAVSSTERPASHPVPHEIQSSDRTSSSVPAMKSSLSSRPDQNQVSQKPSTPIPVKRSPSPHAPDGRQSSLGACAASSIERPASHSVPHEMQSSDRANFPTSVPRSGPPYNQESKQSFPRADLPTQTRPSSPNVPSEKQSSQIKKPPVQPPVTYSEHSAEDQASLFGSGEAKLIQQANLAASGQRPISQFSRDRNELSPDSNSLGQMEERPAPSRSINKKQSSQIEKTTPAVREESSQSAYKRRSSLGAYLTGSAQKPISPQADKLERSMSLEGRFLTDPKIAKNLLDLEKDATADQNSKLFTPGAKQAPEYVDPKLKQVFHQPCSQGHSTKVDQPKSIPPGYQSYLMQFDGEKASDPVRDKENQLVYDRFYGNNVEIAKAFCRPKVKTYEKRVMFNDKTMTKIVPTPQQTELVSNSDAEKGKPGNDIKDVAGEYTSEANLAEQPIYGVPEKQQSAGQVEATGKLAKKAASKEFQPSFREESTKAIRFAAKNSFSGQFSQSPTDKELKGTTSSALSAFSEEKKFRTEQPSSVAAFQTRPLSPRACSQEPSKKSDEPRSVPPGYLTYPKHLDFDWAASDPAMDKENQLMFERFYGDNIQNVATPCKTKGFFFAYQKTFPEMFIPQHYNLPLSTKANNEPTNSVSKDLALTYSTSENQESKQIYHAPDKQKSAGEVELYQDGQISKATSGEFQQKTKQSSIEAVGSQAKQSQSRELSQSATGNYLKGTPSSAFSAVSEEKVSKTKQQSSRTVAHPAQPSETGKEKTIKKNKKAEKPYFKSNRLTNDDMKDEQPCYNRCRRRLDAGDFALSLRRTISYAWTSPPPVKRSDIFLDLPCITENHFAYDIREFVLHVMNAAAPHAKLGFQESMKFANKPDYMTRIEMFLTIVSKPQSGARNPVFKEQSLCEDVDDLFDNHKKRPEAVTRLTKEIVSEKILTQIFNHEWTAIIALVIMGHQLAALSETASPEDFSPAEMERFLVAFLQGIELALEDEQLLLSGALSCWSLFDEKYKDELAADMRNTYDSYNIDELRSFV